MTKTIFSLVLILSVTASAYDFPSGTFQGAGECENVTLIATGHTISIGSPSRPESERTHYVFFDKDFNQGTMDKIFYQRTLSGKKEFILELRGTDRPFIGCIPKVDCYEGYHFIYRLINNGSVVRFSTKDLMREFMGKRGYTCDFTRQ